MKKLINDLNNLYIKNQFNYDVYDWTIDLFNILMENNFMTKVPNNTIGSPCCYKEVYDDYSFDAKRCDYISANVWEYKNVKNDYKYIIGNYEFCIYPSHNTNAYNNISTSIMCLLMILQNREIEYKDLLSLVEILEKITATAIPFGKFSQGNYRYLESSLNIASYAHSLELSKIYSISNMCNKSCEIKKILTKKDDCIYPLLPFCKSDLPTPATDFNKERETIIRNLIVLCFAKKHFEIAIDLFIKYKTNFDWNITTLDLCTREAKSAWGLYTPDKYEPLIYEYFKKTPLNKLFVLQQLIDEHNSLFDTADILPKCAYVFKKIFGILEKETYYAKEKEFLKKVKSLSSNSSLEELIEIAHSNELTIVLDSLPEKFNSPRMKSACSHWIEIYKFEFRDFFLEYNYRYERNFIRNVIAKSINEHTTKELNLLQKHSTNLSEEDKEHLVEQFFLSARDVEEYKNSMPNYNEISIQLNRNLGNIINKIKNNKVIYDCLAASEYLLLNQKSEAENDSLVIDYSTFVMPQIKLVERYLKEILVQYYPDQIYKITNKSYLTKIDFKKENYSKLSAEDLSGNSTNLCQTTKYSDNSFELGSVALALQKIFCENKNYRGIFYSQYTPSTDTKFQKQFIDKVRNGYFHIHIIDSYKEALTLSQKTAYWFVKCISEAPGDIH